MATIRKTVSRDDLDIDHRSSKKSEKLETPPVLVTGGAGYFGNGLVKELAKLGYRVKVFDMFEPETLPPNCEFIKGNLLNLPELERAIENCKLVFHSASAGLSGPGQLNKEICFSVNVDGTQNVLDLCLKHQVQRLVYTSSYNAVFSRHSLINCDESVPYPEDHEQLDFYSRSKKRAEQLVLKYDNTEHSNGKKLRCCALRPNGIYGENEKRHLPRIADNIEAGYTIFRFGTGKVYIDWCHVNNLIQAHVKAAAKLSETEKCIAGGQAYNISDNCPMEPYQFIKPLFDAMEQPLPWIPLPFFLVYIAAYILEILHYAVGVYPIFTRNEIVKVTNSHYCKMDKAINELGYSPKTYKFADAVAILMKERTRKRSWREIIAENQYRIWFSLAVLLCLYYLLRIFTL